MVSITRKRATKGGKSDSAVSRYDSVPNRPEPATVRGTGDAEGRSSLTIERQREVQEEQYRRTLSLSHLYFLNKEQEQRQNTLITEYVTLTVNVAREDFPSISADIVVKYSTEAAQSAWHNFLVDVRVALNLEFIDVILDKMDFSPVHRVMRLRPGGQYYVKQREDSAVLEVIVDGKLPEQMSWPVTQGITKAKDDLIQSRRNQENMDTRVDFIINEPMIRNSQRESLTRLIESETAQEIVDIMDFVMNEVDLPPDELEAALQRKAVLDEEARLAEEERVKNMQEALQKGVSAAELMALNSAEAIKPVFVKLKTFDPEVDIVLLHRVALEGLSRLVLRFPANVPEIADTSVPFIQDAVVRFRDEIDILLTGIKLLGDMTPCLLKQKRVVFTIICDTIQCYAPPPLFYLPRIVHRLLSQEELDEEERLFNLQFAYEDEEEEAPPDLAAEEARMQQLLAELGVTVVGEVEQVVQDDDATIEEVVVEEEEEEEEVVEEEEEVVRGRHPNEKKQWSKSVGIVGKPNRKGEVDTGSLLAALADDDDEDEEEAALPPGAKKKKKLLKVAKFRLRPLPPTKGITHRGFHGTEQFKHGLILQQCFATLYTLVSYSFGFREEAFNLFLHEEVCDVAVVSVGRPRLLEYAIWIVDKMYADGHQNEDKDDDESADPSMQVSHQQVPSQQQKNKDHDDDEEEEEEDVMSIDPVTGKVIEAVSTITQPSIDLDGVNRDAPVPEVNLGGGPEEEGEDAEDVWADVEARLAAAAEVPEDARSNNITADLALDPAVKEREELAKKIAMGGAGAVVAAALKSKMGEKAFNRRYRGRPKDVVIIALALISNHLEVPERERCMASRLLSVFDDCSPSFKFLVVRGTGLNGSIT